jgi:thioredoxin-related protein
MNQRTVRATRRAMLRLCAAILTCALSPTVAAQAIDLAQDLARSAQEAQAARVPLLVFFSQPGCPYCDEARRDYLGPLRSDPTTRSTMRIVEVDITSASRLADFSGRATTHRDFARARRIRFVPVVIFVGVRGEPLTDPLIGLTVPGFYQSYLDRRIEQARSRLAAPAN